MRASDAPTRRIVFADGGGSASCRAIAWLKEREGGEIVTVTLDVGQRPDLERDRDVALQTGAIRAHVVDVREEFAAEFVLPALKANALDEGGAPCITGLERALTARRLVEMARLEQASAVAIANSSTDDCQSLVTALETLDPALEIVSAVPAGPEGVQGARVRGDRDRRSRANLWGRIVVADLAEADGTCEHVDALERSGASVPSEPAYVEIAFERGVPVAVNGVPMSLVELIASLTIIAGAHGVGRGQRIRRHEDGSRSQETYEAPAAVALHAAHAFLQQSVNAEALECFSAAVSREYSRVVAEGLWFTPLREALDAFVDKSQERVTGAVRLRMFAGTCQVVSSHSSNAMDSRSAGSRELPLSLAEHLAAGLR